MLRAYQFGINIRDLAFFDVGEIIDLMIESGNDNAEYPTLATQDDINNLFS